MSYLLLKPRSGRANRNKNNNSSSSSSAAFKSKRFTPTNPAPSLISNIRNTLTTNGNRHRSSLSIVTDGQDQVQQLIQKPVVTPHQKNVSKPLRQHQHSVLECQRQVNSPQVQEVQTSQAQPQQQLADQGIISMEEVMEDLRVLEQQQRESQRLLASVKLTKKHKLDQRSQLETNLSSLKYANGEQRANLSRTREVLSTSTRELGALKLQSNRASADLKNFDKKLKKALTTARELQLYRSKLDASLIEVRNLRSMLSRMKTQAGDNLKSIQMKRDDAVRQEDIILKAMQGNINKARVLVEEVLKMHSNTVGLEHDLSTAQQMETSTKFRVDVISQELLNEKKRFKASKDEWENKINDAKAKKSASLNKIQTIRVDVDIRKQLLRETWLKCIQYQEEEGQEKSNLVDEKSPTLDVSSIRRALEHEESKLREVNMARNSHQKHIEDSQKLRKENQQKESEIRSFTTNLNKEVSNQTETEQKRKSECLDLLKEVEAEHNGVHKLQQSLEELTDRRKKIVVEKENNLALVEKQSLDKSNVLASIERDLASKLDLLQQAKAECSKQKDLHASSITRAESSANKMKSLFEAAKTATDLITEELKEEVNIEGEEKIQEQSRNIQRLQLEMSSIIENKPHLLELNSFSDETNVTKEHIEDLLDKLRKSCESQIEKARNEREHKIEEAKQAHIARCEAEEAERRRIEEEARVLAEQIRQEKIKKAAQEAERKRKEEAERRLLAEEAERIRLAVEHERKLEAERKAKAEAEEKLRKEKEKQEREENLRVEKAKAEAERLRLRLEKEEIAKRELEVKRQAEAKEAVENERIRQLKAFQAAERAEAEKKSLDREKQKNKERLLKREKLKRERAEAKRKAEEEARETEEMLRREDSKRKRLLEKRRRERLKLKLQTEEGEEYDRSSRRRVSSSSEKVRDKDTTKSEKELTETRIRTEHSVKSGGKSSRKRQEASTYINLQKEALPKTSKSIRLDHGYHEKPRSPRDDFGLGTRIDQHRSTHKIGTDKISSSSMKPKSPKMSSNTGVGENVVNNDSKTKEENKSKSDHNIYASATDKKSHKSDARLTSQKKISTKESKTVRGCSRNSSDDYSKKRRSTYGSNDNRNKESLEKRKQSRSKERELHSPMLSSIEPSKDTSEMKKKRKLIVSEKSSCFQKKDDKITHSTGDAYDVEKRRRKRSKTYGEDKGRDKGHSKYAIEPSTKEKESQRKQTIRGGKDSSCSDPFKSGSSSSLLNQNKIKKAQTSSNIPKDVQDHTQATNFSSIVQSSQYTAVSSRGSTARRRKKRDSGVNMKPHRSSTTIGDGDFDFNFA